MHARLSEVAEFVSIQLKQNFPIEGRGPSRQEHDILPETSAALLAAVQQLESQLPEYEAAQIHGQGDRAAFEAISRLRYVCSGIRSWLGISDLPAIGSQTRTITPLKLTVALQLDAAIAALSEVESDEASSREVPAESRSRTPSRSRSGS